MTYCLDKITNIDQPQNDLGMELAYRDFKAVTISFKAVNTKIVAMHEEIGNFSREIYVTSNKESYRT